MPYVWVDSEVAAQVGPVDSDQIAICNTYRHEMQDEPYSTTFCLQLDASITFDIRDFSSYNPNEPIESILQKAYMAGELTPFIAQLNTIRLEKHELITLPAEDIEKKASDFLSNLLCRSVRLYLEPDSYDSGVYPIFFDPLTPNELDLMLKLLQADDNDYDANSTGSQEIYELSHGVMVKIIEFLIKHKIRECFTGYDGNIYCILKGDAL